MIKGHLTPFWNMADIKSVMFAPPADINNGFKLMDYQEEIYNSIDIAINIHKDLPDFIDRNILDNHFNWLRNKMYAIHRMIPNTGLPEHSDKYKYYSKVNGVDDINQIERIIVFLEDKKQGHEFILENYKLEDWKAGDWLSWNGGTAHAAFNSGTEDRFTMQITGIKKN